MVRTVIVSVVAFLLLGVYAYLMTKAYKRKCEVVAVQERALATKDEHIALLKSEYSRLLQDTKDLQEADAKRRKESKEAMSEIKTKAVDDPSGAVADALKLLNRATRNRGGSKQDTAVSVSNN